MASEYERLMKRLQPRKPGQSRRTENWMARLRREDPGFDYTGVKNMKLRSILSAMDTDEERANALNKLTGPEGWTVDRYNNMALTPAGMDRLGLEHKGKPVTIEESDITLNDIGDLSGDFPAMLGAMGASMMTTGVGTVPGAAMVALGTGLGSLSGELAEEALGYNLQPAGEVATKVGTDALAGAAGETIYRKALAPLGRKILAPEAKRVTEEGKRLMNDALKMKVRPNVTQITKAPILGRAQSMMNRIFGDPIAAQNSVALKKEMLRLAHATGPKASNIHVGEAIKHDIGRARQALGRWSRQMYDKVDELSGGKPIIPTARLKQQASDILESLPKTTTASGEKVPTMMSPETINQLKSIMGLDDKVTTGQMQTIRNALYNAIEDNTMVPGVSSHYARMLSKAATKSFDDAAASGSDAAQLLKAVNSRYAKEISKYDQAIVQRIMKDPKYAGAIPPEKITEILFKRGESSNLNKVMNLLPDKTKTLLKRRAMDDLLENLTKRTDDPLVDVFDGKGFLNTLDKYGKDTLEAMFGKAKTEELYRFGEVTQLATQKMAMSGGLVAANIALHPWQNIGRLVKLNLLSRFLNTDTGLKWLTTGLEVPKTRAASEVMTKLMTQLTVLADQEMKLDKEALDGQENTGP